MKKTPSYKVLLTANKKTAPVRSERLTKDVNEILDLVAKEDRLLALSRQRTVDAGPQERSADVLLQILQKGLKPIA